MLTFKNSQYINGEIKHIRHLILNYIVHSLIGFKCDMSSIDGNILVIC